MSPQHYPGPQEKRILHIASRVIFGNIDGIKIKIFGLDFRTEHGLKPDPCKNLNNPLSGLGDQMERSPMSESRGSGDIDSFVIELFCKERDFESRFTGF